MRKFSVIVFLLLAKFSFSQGDTMYVSGRYLYSSAGEKVVLRGMNEMYVWSSDKTGLWSLAEIAKTGANCTRLAWTEAYGDKSQLATLIKNCVDNKMIAIPECHDATGDWSKLNICINFWNNPALVKAVQDNKKWTIVNIGNEVGATVTPADFSAGYMRAIDSLRKWGYTVPIMIDACGWGQNVDVLFSTWKEILGHDPLKNVIFSAHSYWATTVNYTRIADKAKTENMPIVIGEGPSITQVSGCKLLDYQTGLSVTAENEIGWMSWSWGLVDNGDCPKYFDHTTNGRFGSWDNVEAQNLVVEHEFSLMHTSARPASMFSDGIVPVSGIYVSPRNPHIKQGDSVAVKVHLAPINAVDKAFTLSIVQSGDFIRFSKDSSFVIAVNPGNAQVKAVHTATGIKYSTNIYTEDSAIVSEPIALNNPKAVRINPNPVGDSNLIVSFAAPQSGNMHICNQLGQSVFSQAFSGQQSLTIGLSHFAKAEMLYVKIEFEDGSFYSEAIKR